MRGVVGTKHYDTEKSELIQVRPDGTEIYRKRTRPTDFFRYNPAGETARERFQDLTPEESTQLLPPNTASRRASSNSNTVRFKPYDLERIRRCATENGIPINQFLMILVDQYEENIGRR